MENINEQNIIKNKKEKFKIIFLIISSNELVEFPLMRKITTQYMNLFSNDIKHYFLEYHEDIENDIVEKENYLFFKGTDDIQSSIYKKTISAMEYVTNKYDFDYIIRTNISSFWHITNLLKFLENAPKERFAGGYATQTFFTGNKTIPFITGTGIIMSRDVGELVYKNPNILTIIDDVDICDTIVSNGIELYNIKEYKWGYLIPPYTDQIPENYVFLNVNNDDFSNILYFRNKNHDRAIDLNNFQVLLKRLYGLEPSI